jgi:opacity protein-like surface antigen
VPYAHSTAIQLALIAGLVAGAPATAAPPDDDEGFGHTGFYFGVGGGAGIELFEGAIEDVAEDAGVDVSVDQTWVVNARAGYRLASWVALELMYEYMDSFRIEVDSVDVGGTPVPVGTTLADYSTHTGTLNLKLIVPTWRIQPYLLLGAGGQYFDLDASPLVQGTELDFGDSGWAFAGRPGLGVDLYLTKHILLNAEVSGVLSTSSPDTVPDIGDLFYLSAGGGLQYRF